MRQTVGFLLKAYVKPIHSATVLVNEHPV